MSLMKVDQNNLFPRFSDLWEDFLGRDIMERPKWSKGFSMPAVNIEEKPTSFEVSMAVPGMKREDFKIEVDRGVLTVSSEKEDKHEEKDKEGKYTRREFSYHTFSRSFTLPEAIDREKIEAKYSEGILAIHLPKQEPSRQLSKQISVK